MMDFDTAIERVLKIEGGYVNDPADPGGETNFGISKRSYPDVDIQALTRQQAIDFYRRDFWDKVSGSDLYPSIAYQTLDFAVNSSPATAIRYLQRALGVADDGHFGPMSIAAAKAISESDQVMLFNAERLDFMRKLKAWKDFGAGWAGRIAENLRYGAMDT